MIRTALAILVRPWLWRSALRFVPSRWWTFRPYLPIPSKAYRQFRLQTMYGDPEHPWVTADVVRFLTWCRRTHRLYRVRGES